VVLSPVWSTLAGLVSSMTRGCGTWSKNPPHSSKFTTSSVRAQPGPLVTAR